MNPVEGVAVDVGCASVVWLATALVEAYDARRRIDLLHDLLHVFGHLWLWGPTLGVRFVRVLHLDIPTDLST